jgi:hypothetical protein
VKTNSRKKRRNDRKYSVYQDLFWCTADHPEAVYKTFLLILENVEKRHPLAGEISRDIALLHPDGISEKLYADYDPLELDKALAALKDYSLIQRVAMKYDYILRQIF